jgi:hypothetical protein
MGGTGSYDPYRPDPGRPTGDPGTGCLDLRFTATIQVPAEPVDVERNAVLEIVRITVGEGSLIVGALDADGVLVGSIIDGLDRLLPCLSQGIAFIGEVIVVNHGVPHIRVSAASISRVLGQASLHRSPHELPSTAGNVSLRLDGGSDTTLAIEIVAASDGRVIGVVEHKRQSELRALMRVGMEFSGDVDGEVIAINRRQ